MINNSVEFSKEKSCACKIEVFFGEFKANRTRGTGRGGGGSWCRFGSSRRPAFCTDNEAVIFATLAPAVPTFSALANIFTNNLTVLAFATFLIFIFNFFVLILPPPPAVGGFSFS